MGGPGEGIGRAGIRQQVVALPMRGQASMQKFSGRSLRHHAAGGGFVVRSACTCAAREAIASPLTPASEIRFNRWGRSLCSAPPTRGSRGAAHMFRAASLCLLFADVR